VSKSGIVPFSTEAIVPDWVKDAGPSAIWAWENHYQWRCNAYCASDEEYREHLISVAADRYRSLQPKPDPALGLSVTDRKLLAAVDRQFGENGWEFVVMFFDEEGDRVAYRHSSDAQWSVGTEEEAEEYARFMHVS